MKTPGEEASVGIHVPSVSGLKAELTRSENIEAGQSKKDLDKDILCPICFQTMKDAFSTSCGHSFCYTCIMTHLNNKKNCPCCGLYLTSLQVFPNFLLNKLLKKASACQLVSTVTPLEHFKMYLQEGAEVSVKELDSLISVLAEKKRKAEQEEAELNMEILLDFLQRLHQQKQEELNELQADLQFIKEDVVTVEKQRQELVRAREKYSMKLCMPSGNICNAAITVKSEVGMEMVSASSRKEECREIVSSMTRNWRIGGGARNSFSNSQGPVASHSTAITKKKRILSQFEDLQECYLLKRRRMTCIQKSRQLESSSRKDRGASNKSTSSGLEDFQSILNSFTRYSRLRAIAELCQGDLFHSPNIVSSIEFDRDDKLFATAGVSRRIKIFEFCTVVNVPADVHFPVVEMTTRAKLICLSWNKYIENQIASSDYEGIVTVWDVNT